MKREERRGKEEQSGRDAGVEFFMKFEAGTAGTSGGFSGKCDGRPR